jgi:hypothetical protein
MHTITIMVDFLCYCLQTFKHILPSITSKTVRLVGKNAWTQNVSFSLQILLQKCSMFQQIFCELCGQDVQEHIISSTHYCQT